MSLLSYKHKGSVDLGEPSDDDETVDVVEVERTKLDAWVASITGSVYTARPRVEVLTPSYSAGIQLPRETHALGLSGPRAKLLERVFEKGV